MFCNNCGAQSSDDARYCASCGNSLLSSSNDTNFRMEIDSVTKLVPAKCTGCGASLEVDASEKAAVCPYCNNAYIVEQAINNYNINMSGNVNVGSATINLSGVNVDNLLVRAKDFELKADFKNALEYYNQVLDIDFSKQEAHDGIKRVKNAIDDYIHFESYAKKEFSTGVLQLKKDRIIFLAKNNKEETYYLEKIANLKTKVASIQFEYPKKFGGVTIYLEFGANKKWFDIINSAKIGEYPEVDTY